MKKTKVSRYKYKWGGIAGRILGTGIGALAGNPLLGMQIGGMAGDAVDGSTATAKQEKPSLIKRYAPASYGYRNGGQVPGVRPMKGGAQKYVGPKHEQGGVPINSEGTPTDANNATAEVEGGETEEGGYIFSDTLKVPNSDMTFADMHEKLVNENAPQQQIEQLKVLQEQTQEAEGVQGGDEMKNGGLVKKYLFGGPAVANNKLILDTMAKAENPNAPNEKLLTASRFIPSAMRLGIAAFAPRNDEPTAKVSAAQLPVTSPVFNNAKRDLRSGYTTIASNPNASHGQRLAAQSQYQKGVSEVAGKEADYRQRIQEGNANRKQQASAMNSKLSQVDREASARETAGRLKLINDAIEMPVTMYRADEASKRKAITDIMMSDDKIADPIDRMNIIRAKLTALGLSKAEIQKILNSYKIQ